MTQPDDLGSEIGHAVRDLLRTSADVYRALARRLDMGVTDVLALDHITSSDTAPGVVELGDRLGIRSASATSLVERLVNDEHLVKRPHPIDGRRLTLHPTEHARAEVLATLAPLIADLRELTDVLEPAAATTILSFLRGVQEVLTRFAAVPSTPDAPSSADPR